MARKKSGTPGDVNPPGMTDAAGMLATFASGFLAQPASRAQEVSIRLGHAERTILIGLPELDVNLKRRLDIVSTGTTSIRLTVDELVLASTPLWIVNAAIGANQLARKQQVIPLSGMHDGVIA